VWAVDGARRAGPPDGYRSDDSAKVLRQVPGCRLQLQLDVGEAIIHSEDIRRPLGIAHTYAPAAVLRVADFYKGSNTLIGAKNRIAGVTLHATDADWSHGSGPEVNGPLLSLVMAMTGRKVALNDLEGPGVEVLRSRD